MKKYLALLFIIPFVAVGYAQGAAITIKKAAPVATQSANKKETMLNDGLSLVGTVMNLVGTVKDLNVKQKQLTEECIPSGSDISFVNEMIKEWAKAGGGSVSKISSAMGGEPCSSADEWAEAIKDYGGPENVASSCYEAFVSSYDEGTVWYKYPKATVARYCPDEGGDDCKNKATVSNIYDVLNLIDFSDKDYSKGELDKFARLREKIETCSDAKISARQKALWGEFLNNTVASMGQKNNMPTIMNGINQVTGSMGNGSGFDGVVQSLSGIATQFIGQ